MESEKLRVLRGSVTLLAGLFLCFAIATARAQTPAVIEVRIEGGLARVSVEAPQGGLVDAGVSSRREELLLHLKAPTQADTSSLIENFKKFPAFKAARVLPSEPGQRRILIEFSRPVSVLEETILALPNQMSRWELVLSSADAGQAKPLPKPELGQVTATRRNGRVDIVLSGNLGLEVEASFKDQPPRLIVNLPGVALQQARSVVGAFYSDAELVKTAFALASKEGGQTQIEFELAQSADLIDTQGIANGDQGQVVLSLVPDAAADPRKVGQLGSLGFEVGSDFMQMRLVGTGNSMPSAYTIEEPPRLVVDFLGWAPERVQEALAQFGSQSAALLGQPRLDTTRRGSARAVFDLAVSAPLKTARSLRLPADGTSGAFIENFVISLAPGEAAGRALASRNPLDLRFRRELMENREAAVFVRPLTLEGSDRFASAALKPQGSAEIGLISLLDAAMQADAKYLASKAEFSALREALPQARADYLPTASFDYQLSRAKQNIVRAANEAFPTGESRYDNKNLVLTITQPIFKPQAWVKIGQAELLVNQAQLNLVAAEQDLILRVAVSYLSVLAANDGVELARAERMAVEKQHEDAKARLESGLGTISQKQDTEARLLLTRAREIEAENRAEDARLALKEIIGRDISEVRGFKRDFNASLPLPSSAQAWVEASLEQNLALQSRKIAVEIAGMEIRRQQAGHLPTLTLTASLAGQDATGSIYGAGQKSEEANVGFRLSLPLATGGLTSSLVRESVARREKAGQEREQELRRTERLARSSFNGVVTSAKTLEALRQTVLAQEMALQTRLEGYNSGLFNVVAVMDAYRLYYAAQRDFLQARYDYLGNRLKLRQAVGSLGRADLEDIAALLE